MAAAQYRNRMVRSLISEKVSNYVLDLLAFNLLFSLWALFLLRADVLTPYFGIVVSCVITTVSVASLAVYRNHALSVVQPREALQTMVKEVSDLVGKVAGPNKNLGRSVENHIHNRAAETIEDMAELAETLLDDRKDDSEGANALVAVCQILEQYTKHKRFIHPTSLWFPMREVLLTPQDGYGYVEMKRIYERYGLGEPYRQQQNNQWLEQRIFAHLARLRKIISKDEYSTSHLALIIGIGKLLQTCLEEQEFNLLDKALDELEAIGGGLNDEKLNSWGGELLNTLVKLAYSVLEGMNTGEVKQAMEGIDWHSDREIHDLRLPRFSQDYLLDYQGKLETEHLIEGNIVTPPDWIERDIMDAMVAQEKKIMAEYFKRLIEQLASVKSNTYKERSMKIAGNSCYMQLLMIHRAVARGKPNLASENFSFATADVPQIYAQLSDENRLRQSIFNELRTLCLLLINLQNEQAFSQCVDIFCAISGVELSLGVTETIEYTLDGVLVIGSLAFVVSELNTGNKSIEMVTSALQRNFNFSALLQALELMTNIHGYGIRWGTNAIMSYWDYFRPVFDQIQKLPKRPFTSKRKSKFDMDLYEVFDHPSKFIQKFSNFPMGPDITDCAEGFIAKLKEKLSKSPEQGRLENE
jgi:hypothetical protein